MFLFRQETLQAIESILKKTTRHEIAVQNRFNALQQFVNHNLKIVDFPALHMLPIRVEIPEVNHGFVYLLVSLRDRSLKTCYAQDTCDSLLAELSRHNAGQMKCITGKLELQPWSLAAFVFGFPTASERLILSEQLRAIVALKLRVDQVIDKFRNLADCEEYGSLSFCKCGNLINRILKD